jgi:hypothetical protein
VILLYNLMDNSNNGWNIVPSTKNKIKKKKIVKKVITKRYKNDKQQRKNLFLEIN